MIVETLLIPILNNVAGKLVDSGVEKLRSSHEVNVLRAISRSRLLREISLNLEVSKLLYAKRGSVASLEECKFKVLEDLMEGALPLDYLLNHARLGDPVVAMLGEAGRPAFELVAVDDLRVGRIEGHQLKHVDHWLRPPCADDRLSKSLAPMFLWRDHRWTARRCRPFR